MPPTNGNHGEGSAPPPLAARVFEALFERSLDPALIVGPDGKVIRANAAAASALGWSPEELVGRGRGEIVVANEAHRAMVADRTRTGPVRSEVICRRSDGSAFPAEVTSVAIDDGPAPIVHAVFRDLTAGREAARALIESEQRFAAIFDRSPISMALSRLPETTYVAANDAFRALFEIGDVDVVGKTGVELGIAPPDAWARTTRELLEEGSLRSREVTRLTRTGQERKLLLSMEPVSIGGQRHVISIAVDVTAKGGNATA
jgi:PAS domain S-box-containing protein